MAKVSAGDIRNGVTIEVDGKVCQVIDFMHVKPGKGAAFVRVKMKNIIDGGVVETTFRPTETFEQAHIERKKMQYLYNDGEFYNYMDNETFEQIKKQLNRMVEVIKVMDLTNVPIHMKEIMFAKVKKLSNTDKAEVFRIAQVFHVETADIVVDSVLLECKLTERRNNELIELLKQRFQSVEIVRGGAVAIESIATSCR